MSRSPITNLPLPAKLRDLLTARTGRRFRLPLAALAVLTAAVLLVYSFVTAPAAARLAEQEGRHAELKRQYADALIFQKQKRSLTGLLEGIPAQKDVPLLIKDLVQSARRLNLSVGAVNSDIPSQQGGGALTMVTFSFPVSGPYAGIKRFIYEVETTDRLVGIRDLRLDAEKGAVRLDMKLVTYIRGE